MGKCADGVERVGIGTSLPRKSAILPCLLEFAVRPTVNGYFEFNGIGSANTRLTVISRF